MGIFVPDVRNEATNEIRDQYLDAGKARTALGLRTTIDRYTRYIAALGGRPEPEARCG
jgi:hypothetical protein